MIIIKQMAKKCLWCKEHPSSERKARSFCFNYRTAKGSKSFRQEVLLHRDIIGCGCIRVCACGKAVRSVAIDFFFFFFFSWIWLMLGFLKTLKEIDCVPPHWAPHSFQMFCTEFERFDISGTSQSCLWLQRDQPLLTRNRCKIPGISALQYSASHT